ncbi:hypothetical protein Hanom_Chr01g00088401 [Helianthus anomalus]
MVLQHMFDFVNLFQNQFPDEVIYIYIYIYIYICIYIYIYITFIVKTRKLTKKSLNNFFFQIFL